MVVYDSKFRGEELSVQMFPRGFQNVVTDTRCLFNGVTGLKRLTIRSTEEPVYDYSYRVKIDLSNTSIEELYIDLTQRQCVLSPYIRKCQSLKRF